MYKGLRRSTKWTAGWKGTIQILKIHIIYLPCSLALAADMKEMDASLSTFMAGAWVLKHYIHFNQKMQVSVDFRNASEDEKIGISSEIKCTLVHSGKTLLLDTFL